MYATRTKEDFQACLRLSCPVLCSLVAFNIRWAAAEGGLGE